MDKLLRIIIPALLLSACAHQQAETAGAFAHADSNHDHKISLNEWQLIGGKDAAFLAVDRERVGSLTESQFYEAQRLNDSLQQTSEGQRQAVDNQLAQAVRNALASDSSLNAWSIRVEVYQGNVQLSGVVHSDREKSRAQDIASSVTGIKQVFNSIAIKY